MDVRDLIDGINSLDFENIGGWPRPAKIASAVLVFAIVLLIGYFVSIKDLNHRHERAQQKEAQLLDSFEAKAFKAHNLGEYREQLADLEQRFDELKSQLPKDTEVPGLLEDITQTGVTAGLEFRTIALKEEVDKEFYAELPIDIEVLGDYHSFATFVSGVAALSRIVTLHNFNIKRVSGKGDAVGALDMNITARTYRYSEDGSGVDNNTREKDRG